MDQTCRRLRVPTVFELLTLSLYSVKTRLLGSKGVTCKTSIKSKGNEFRKYCDSEGVKIDATKDLRVLLVWEVRFTENDVDTVLRSQKRLLSSSISFFLHQHRYGHVWPAPFKV